MPERVTERLAQWLSSRDYEDLPPEVREKTVEVIFDTVACAIACSRLPEVRAIVDLVESIGGEPHCSLIGYRAKSSVVNAAMVNGGMARGGEADAVHMTSSGGHVAPGPVSTALTVGEWLDSSGRDVLRAVALAYEVGGRLMTIFYRERDYITRRFYPTSVIANLTSAIAAGLVLGLDARGLQAALGLAAYQAAGPDNMTKDPGHMGMTFQCAAANRNGVTAALLARQGSHVPLDILDGPLGFFDTYLGKPELGAELIDGLGSSYSIMDVMYKRYPVGTPNQAYAQGLIGLLERHVVASEDIAAIEIQMPRRSLHTAPKTRHPSIAVDVVSALAAVERKLDFYRLHDPAGMTITAELARMQKKIRFVPRDDWAGTEHNRHAIVTVTTTGGKRLEEDVWFRPMTRQELGRKFGDLVTPQFGAQRAESLRRALEGIAGAASVRPLMHSLCA
ncbi:MAG TPA: MmgE/PrpD family protein [Burkholderiales bacterium]|nr:MmgE/PrpD family protein [Burkholderiales bacterium]